MRYCVGLGAALFGVNYAACWLGSLGNSCLYCGWADSAGVTDCHRLSDLSAFQALIQTCASD